MKKDDNSVPLTTVLGAAGGLAALASVMGAVNVKSFYDAVLPVKRVFMETGLQLPATVELGLGLSDVLFLGTIAVALAAPVLAGVAARKVTSPERCRAIAVAIVVTGLLAQLMGTLPLSSLGRAFSGIEDRYLEVPGEPEPPEVIPGRAAELAQDIVAKLRASLLNRRGVVKVNGADHPYALLGSGLADYATCHARDDCLLFPWGPRDNKAWDKEPFTYFPRPANVDLAPASLRPDGPRDQFELATSSPWGLQVPRVRRVQAIPDGDFSFALMLRRASLGKSRWEPHLRQYARDPDRFFSDDLQEVRVMIFRRFDESRAGAESIPYMNQPVREFVALVRP